MRPMRTLVMVVFAGCGGGAPSMMPSNRVPATASATPDLAALRTLLHARADFAFDAAANRRGCPTDQTFGAYLAMLEKTGSPAPDGDTHSLSGGCGPFPEPASQLDPPSDPAYWFCKVEAHSNTPDADSPWHYWLEVRVRKIDRVIDVATLSCPGL